MGIPGPPFFFLSRLGWSPLKYWGGSKLTWQGGLSRLIRLTWQDHIDQWIDWRWLESQKPHIFRYFQITPHLSWYMNKKCGRFSVSYFQTYCSYIILFGPFCSWKHVDFPWDDDPKIGQEPSHFAGAKRGTQWGVEPDPTKYGDWTSMWHGLAVFFWVIQDV